LDIALYIQGIEIQTPIIPLIHFKSGIWSTRLPKKKRKEKK
jgi:hypothetical protein